MTHDRISFTREYCRCRRIPYRIKGESFYIGEFHFNAVFIPFSIIHTPTL